MVEKKKEETVNFPLKERVTLKWDGDKVICHTEPASTVTGQRRIMCPCGDYVSYTGDAMRVARHMLGKFDQPHIYWIEANGLDPRELLLMKGGYKKLALFLEKRANK